MYSQRSICHPHWPTGSWMYSMDISPKASTEPLPGLPWPIVERPLPEYGIFVRRAQHTCQGQASPSPCLDGTATLAGKGAALNALTCTHMLPFRRRGRRRRREPLGRGGSGTRSSRETGLPQRHETRAKIAVKDARHLPGQCRQSAGRWRRARVRQRYG